MLQPQHRRAWIEVAKALLGRVEENGYVFCVD